MSEYRLRRELGRGGMGVVYEAERVLDGGTVLPAACKAISPELAAREDVVERFRREAAVCIRLSGDHPNLVTVYDLHRDAEGRLLLAMELVDGAPLSALVRGVPLPHPIVRRLVHDILQGLAHVHAAAVVHRDISPENVLVSKQGAVKLSDFGLSKVLSDTSHRSQPTFKGKAAYASPEAIHGNALDPRADLWSLAAMTHELLAGTPPFGRGDIWHILSVQGESGPAALPADVPDDLRALTADLTVLASNERRFQRAADMIRVLVDVAGPMSTPAELGAFVAEMCRRPGGEGDEARADTQQSPAQPQQGHRRSRTTDHGRRPPRAPYLPAALPPLPVKSGKRKGMVLLIPAALLALGISFAIALYGRPDALHEAAPAAESASSGERAIGPALSEEPAPPAAPPELAEEAAGLEPVAPSTQRPRTQAARKSEKDTAILPKRRDGPEQRRRPRAHPSSSERRPKRHVVPDATIPQ